MQALIDFGVENALDTRVLPWICSPYSLHTWWDMEHFSARGFFWAGVMMEAIKSDCLQESLAVDPDEPIYNFSASINERTRARRFEV
jgi:hypothetical protein